MFPLYHIHSVHVHVQILNHTLVCYPLRYLTEIHVSHTNYEVKLLIIINIEMEKCHISQNNILEYNISERND